MLAILQEGGSNLLQPSRHWQLPRQERNKRGGRTIEREEEWRQGAGCGRSRRWRDGACASPDSPGQHCRLNIWKAEKYIWTPGSPLPPRAGGPSWNSNSRKNALLASCQQDHANYLKWQRNVTELECFTRNDISWTEPNKLPKCKLICNQL